ncbi:MAG TPA: immune inhibitor A domain-containing protein, partial [Anaerolineales bacterium]
MKAKTFHILLVLTLLLVSMVPAVIAAPAASHGFDDNPEFVPKEDNRPDPLTTGKTELKEQALEAKLNGKAYGRTHEVARGQFVELAREGEDPVWTVLGEFSDMPHNVMPEPDRSVDNSNIWTADFSRDHYLELLFAEGAGVNSMRQYYIEQSTNRYTVHGDVTDWVPVPGVAASYDDDFASPLGGNQVWYFLIDSLNGWYDMQIAAGKTPAEIDEYLSGFDVWDRYDWDLDGIFDEPDGYIDHMQFVHAGPGNESCSPACDDWAIWSHSWFA